MTESHTDWKAIAVRLRDALRSSEKWWEHKELLQRVADLLEDQKDKTPLTVLGLPTRIYGALMRSGCNTVEKLRDLREDQILSIRGLGESSLPIIFDSIGRWSSQTIP